MSINRNPALLHPKFLPLHTRLIGQLGWHYKVGNSQFRFELFEGFRFPDRQVDMVLKKASKAGPWESAHQYGLAGDYVPFLSQAEARALGVKPGWYWPEASDEVWHVLKQVATETGLICDIPWDRNHVEHPLFKLFQAAMKQF